QRQHGRDAADRGRAVPGRPALAVREVQPKFYGGRLTGGRFSLCARRRGAGAVWRLAGSAGVDPGVLAPVGRRTRPGIWRDSASGGGPCLESGLVAIAVSNRQRPGRCGDSEERDRFSLVVAAGLERDEPARRTESLCPRFLALDRLQ